MIPSGSYCSIPLRKKYSHVRRLKQSGVPSNASFRNAFVPDTARVSVGLPRVGSPIAHGEVLARSGGCEPMARNFLSKLRSPRLNLAKRSSSPSSFGTLPNATVLRKRPNSQKRNSPKQMRGSILQLNLAQSAVGITISRLVRRSGLVRRTPNSEWHRMRHRDLLKNLGSVYIRMTASICSMHFE